MLMFIYKIKRSQKIYRGKAKYKLCYIIYNYFNLHTKRNNNSKKKKTLYLALTS